MIWLGASFPAVILVTISAPTIKKITSIEKDNYEKQLTIFFFIFVKFTRYKAYVPLKVTE